MERLLCEIAEITAGQGAPQGDKNYSNVGTPFVKAGNLYDLTNGASIDSIQKVSEDVAKAYRLKLYKRGTILFAKSGMSCLKGYVYVLPCDAYVVNHLACITPFEDLSEYLRHFFIYHKPNQLIKDDSYPSISLTDIGNLQIDIKTKEDREKIVKVLNMVNKLLFLRKKQLQKLDDLVKARFVEMFGDPEYNNKGWQIKKLNELCSVGSSKRIYQEEQTMEGVPFWRISDLVAKMDTGNVESSLFIPESKYQELKAQGLVPESGDILVTSRGTLGRCYIVTPNDRFYFQDGMISWLSQYEDAITPLYIQFLFSMPGFRKQIDGMQAGSTVAYLSIAMLKKLDIMLPDRATQERFAAFVSQVDKSKLSIQQGLEKLETMKKSLMQQYFG